MLPKEPKVKPDTTTYTSELDEFKLTLRKEKPPVNEQPSVSSVDNRSEFDSNTETIMKKAQSMAQSKVQKVASPTERILREYFAGVCNSFISSECTDSSCKRLHKYPSETTVRAVLKEANLKTIDEAYGVTTQNSGMFEKYFALFAELFIKKDKQYEQRIARMIMDCEKTPRLTSLYTVVVEALVLHASLPRYKAIKFLIHHHVDTPIAQDIILDLIITAGPDLIRFMDYLMRLSEKRTIPIKVIDQVLLNCVTFQNPYLPMFCLNNMLNRSREQIAQLNSDSLERFLNLQNFLSQINDDREQKLASILQKLT